VVIVMDLHTRQLLDEAIALDDQARVEYACWEAKWAEREQVQAQTQLVYKVYEPKVAAAPMVDAVDKAWVKAQLDIVAAVIGEETLKEDAKLRAEIKTLKAEVAALKSEVELLKQKNVTPMRKQNAA
jgi:hypothetical protein